MYADLLANGGQFAILFLALLLVACLASSFALTLWFAVVEQIRIRHVRLSSIAKYGAILLVMFAVGAARAAVPVSVLFGINSWLDAFLEIVFRGKQYVPVGLFFLGAIAAFFWQLSLLGHVERIQEYVRANPNGDQWQRLKLGSGNLSDLLAAAVKADLHNRSILGWFQKRMARKLASELGSQAPDILNREYIAWRSKNPPVVSQQTRRSLSQAKVSNPADPRKSTLALIQVILEDGGSPFLTSQRVTQIIAHHG